MRRAPVSSVVVSIRILLFTANSLLYLVTIATFLRTELALG
jgi:hypothetical protein